MVFKLLCKSPHIANNDSNVTTDQNCQVNINDICLSTLEQTAVPSTTLKPTDPDTTLLQTTLRPTTDPDPTTLPDTTLLQATLKPTTDPDPTMLTHDESVTTVLPTGLKATETITLEPNIRTTNEPTTDSEIKTAAKLTTTEDKYSITIPTTALETDDDSLIIKQALSEVESNALAKVSELPVQFSYMH